MACGWVWGCRGAGGHEGAAGGGAFRPWGALGSQRVAFWRWGGCLAASMTFRVHRALVCGARDRCEEGDFRARNLPLRPAETRYKVLPAAHALHAPPLRHLRSLRATCPPPFVPERSQIVLAGRRTMPSVASGLGSAGWHMGMGRRAEVVRSARGAHTGRSASHLGGGAGG